MLKLQKNFSIFFQKGYFFKETNKDKKMQKETTMYKKCVIVCNAKHDQNKFKFDAINNYDRNRCIKKCEKFSEETLRIVSQDKTK